jgi:hypothetical protein
MSVRWQFVEINREWTWRLIAHDSVIRTSAPHSNFGVTVTDAIRQGFQPAIHHWHVITTNGITRFDPGAAPKTSPERRQITDGMQAVENRRATDTKF